MRISLLLAAVALSAAGATAAQAQTPCDTYSQGCPVGGAEITPPGGGAEVVDGGGATSVGGAQLPFTGGEVLLAGGLGLAAVAGGATLLVAGRRRPLAD